MGCCTTPRSSSESFIFCKKLKEAIDRSNLSLLSEIWKGFATEKASSLISQPIFNVHDLKMSPLAYSLWIGKLQSFQFIHKQLGADIRDMEMLFSEQGKSALEILCAHGSLELLQYYLPIYLDSLNNDLQSVTEGSITVDFQRSTLVQNRPFVTYTPAHIACEHGHVHIINFLHSYFKNRGPVPIVLSIDYQDELSGENCALIACRKGDYKMVKLLFEVCKANFFVFNKRMENPIMVTAAASKRRSTHDFYNLFVYLVEVVKLDITYMHEEVLLLLEDKNILKYYEAKLQQKGISAEKQGIEKKYEIVKPDYQMSKKEQLIEEQGEHFEVAKTLENDRDNTQSILSAIPEDARVATPFMSTISLDGK